MMTALAMGKYGAYVWTCFGLTLFVFVIIEWRTRARHKRIYKDVAMRLRASEETQ